MIVNSSFANAFILRLICVKICRSRIQRYSADRTIFIAENFLGNIFVIPVVLKMGGKAFLQ